MAHEFILTRISNDFKTSIQIDEQELKKELMDSEFRLETTVNSFHSIEIKSDSKWANLVWYSPKSKRLFQNSKYFMGNPKMIKPLIKFAKKMNMIIFGDEGELYYIPNIGQLREGNFFNQPEITVMELAEKNLKLENQKGIKLYIKEKDSSI